MENSQNIQSVVDSFRNEWDRGKIPYLAHFLSNFSDADPQTRRRLLLELIAVDLENKWRRRDTETATESGLHDTAIQEKRTGTGPLSSQPQLLEGYVSEWSELGGVDDIPTSLVVHSAGFTEATGSFSLSGTITEFSFGIWISFVNGSHWMITRRFLGWKIFKTVLSGASPDTRAL